MREHRSSFKVDHSNLILTFQIDIYLSGPVRRQELGLAAEFNRRINHICFGIGGCLQGDQNTCVAA